MPENFAELIQDLRRRRVFRAAAVYVVSSWLVLQVCDLAFPAYGIPDAALRYVILAAVLGFPVTVFFSWTYEVTTAGIVRTKPFAESAQEQLKVPLRTADYVILVALVVIIGVIGYGTVTKVAGTPEPAPWLDQPVPANSVAVLPFVNMSDDKTNEYFSDGITEELLDRLARIDGLHVAARTSSFHFKNKDMPIGDIATQLGVRNVIEGSVRKAGNTVRITAQLIDAQTGYHLWSESYDRDLEDIFAVQDDIAKRISRELGLTLSSADASEADGAAPTPDVAAYDLYLQGQHQLRIRGEDAILRSIDLFEKALARDPGFSRAHNALATAYAVLPEYSDQSAELTYPVARMHALKAIDLEPTFGAPHGVLGYMSMRRWQWRDADPLFQHAILLEPQNASIQQWYSNYLNDVGRQAEALDAAEQAYRLDRVSPVVNVVLAFNYALGGTRYDNLALQHAAAAREFGYTGTLDDTVRFIVNLRQVDYGTATRELELAYAAAGKDAAWIGPFVAAVKDPARKAAALSELAAAVSTQSDGEMFLLYMLLGQADKVFDIAFRHMEDRRLPYAWLLLPEAAGFREDPRFRSLAEQIGLVEFWQESGWPPICQPDPDGFRCQ